ncbi:MAG: choice-of-anchor B domain-containing protein, partial [Myxococcota bacterium]
TVPAPAGIENFGARIAAARMGEHLLVAAPGTRGAASTIFAYTRTPTEWEANGRFNTDNLPERSGFGDAFAVEKGVAFIGAPGIDARSGRVLVYDLVNGSASDEPAATLGPVLAESNARFGASISIQEDALWVGAPGTQGVGGAYAFSGRGSFDFMQMLHAEDAERGASLGGFVAAAGRVGVVAATGIDEGQGAAFVYERSSEGVWSQSGMLTNPPRGFPALAGDEIHCTDGQAAIFDCQDVNITAFLPISALGGSRGTRVNDVWGWTDPDNDVEYVIVGRTNGTSFVNISDPYNPVYVGDLPKTEGSRTTIWRDMKVYANHVYVVADAAGEHGVQVFDLTQLRDFDGEPLALEETFRYEGIHSAHNIVINEETGFAYAVGNSGGGETCGGGLHMINLENPARPTFAGCYSEMGTGRRGTGYSHDAQCVVYRGPDEDHQGKEICLGSNETALNIADVSDKSAPVSIATASYPSVAYAHQGWLTEDHTFFYMNDEGDEPQGLVEGTRTLVWDVTDLDDPILVKEHIAETTATDHNLYVKGDRMYQSNYSAGFRVLDVSNPADPVEIGFLDTSPYEGGASWSNYPFFKSGVIAVTGTGDGLFLVRDMARRNLIP